MKKFLIADGSSLFYRAFHALPGLTAPSGEPTNAVVGFANIILKILRERKPDLAVVALDAAKKTFRNELFADYKAKRQTMPDDLAAQLPLLKEFIDVLGIKTCAAVGYEADDIIGTLATQACAECNVEILTGDRDALQLINATTHVLLNRNSGIGVYDEATFRDEYGFAPYLLVDYKGLCGDASDNIPGVKGIGVKHATALIQSFGPLENILKYIPEVKHKKIRAFLRRNYNEAILSKRLAKIVCDVPDVTFDAETFTFAPDIARADEFCDRYALNLAKRKIHAIFAPQPVVITLFDPPPTFDAPPCEFDKIIATQTVALAQVGMAHFGIKIFGGEMFTAAREDVQRLFSEFKGQIVLSGVKDYMRKFDVAALDKIFDLELAAYLIYPERGNAIRNDDLGLGDDLAAMLTRFEKITPLCQSKMAEANLNKLYSEIELPLTTVLARMEERGVFVDKEQLKLKSKDMTARIGELEQKIYELAGETFNINSSKQLADVLFESLKLPPVKKTRYGYSTDAEVLEELKWRHPVVAEILQYRMLSKLRSTYLEGLVKLLDENGRVHTNFNQTVTATGRLSSSDPNLQNIPVRTDEGREIRAMFTAGAGFDCIVSADYSQIELRLLAHMSGDTNLIDAFKRGQDIHARTAAEVFEVPIEAVTPDLRRKAKAVNFGIVYGISAYGLARDLHISREEAGEYIVRYFTRYPEVKDFLDATVAQAHLHGFVTTMFGRRRALPDINSINFNKRTLAERMAMNTPIQGSAADIIKLAMIRAEDNLRGLDSRLILQVHDELVVEAKNSELSEVERILREAMEGVIELKVPLVVDVHSGANWSLAK